MRCDVLAPADCVGDVMAELNRIGGVIRDLQSQDSRAVLRVGIPEGNVILFEKWLAKEFRGDATSRLLPADGNG
jgi:hypothetical protein